MSEPEVAFAGPYILGKTLGLGAYGKVALGTDRRTGEQVAVKIIRKGVLQRSQEELRKIIREIAVLRLINHPHILRLLDVIQTSKYLFLILEYLSGGELFQLLRKEKLTLEVAFKYFHTIVGAIEYCHGCCICHRDLKAENILFDANGSLKIADFGMASLVEPGEFLETSCGSPHYASPEVIRGLKYDGTKSDIWSCGVLYFGLCVGRLPFVDANMQQLLHKVCAGGYTMPSKFPAALSNFIASMLTIDPEKRITIKEMRAHPWWIKMCITCDLDSAAPCGCCSMTINMNPSRASKASMELISRAEMLTSDESEDVIGPHEVEGKGKGKAVAKVPTPEKQECKAVPEEIYDLKSKNHFAALEGIDDITNSSILKTRLRELVTEIKSVQAHASGLEEQLQSLSKGLLQASAAQQSTPSTKSQRNRVSPVPTGEDLQAPVTIVQEEIMRIFCQWGWDAEDAKEKIFSPGPTMEKALYNLMQHYIQVNGSVPVTHPINLSRDDSKQNLLQQLVRFGPHLSANKNMSEGVLTTTTRKPTVPWPALRQFSEGSLLTTRSNQEDKKKKFRWGKLFRWKANVQDMSSDSKKKDTK
mmetsp:Transcript_103149/g.177815  ORF Transcript_103149/g.177815 Transcript_103149/m.177815 type:complete len:588 (-) Transcript_103149:463-2226(-)